MRKFKCNLGLRHGSATNSIAAIKQMRDATGCGLKEAKDAVDSLRNADGQERKAILTGEHIAMLALNQHGDTCFYVDSVNEHKGEDLLDLTSLPIPVRIAA